MRQFVAEKDFGEEWTERQAADEGAWLERQRSDFKLNSSKETNGKDLSLSGISRTGADVSGHKVAMFTAVLTKHCIMSVCFHCSH
jgi:hypothetical protein